ncbi:MAG TPA: SDR family NAD(P)-dependent oxidoreductase, partial [Thermoanaerobaculia bacterium]|nr:SDR family NAD(P)-dependent oxidoreductase [Thermoanaerobaculia bacterium]
VSAKTPEALDGACARLADDLRKRPEADGPDAARTLLAGRAALDRRRVVVAAGLAEAAELLSGADPARLREGVAEPGRAPVAFLLPGQGSQYSGMGAGLYERQPLYRRELDRAAEILAPCLELPAGGLPELLGRRRAPSEGTAQPDPLEGTALAQPLLFAVEHALARLWMSWGVEPDALLGHSVGELTAACLAGVLELEEALPLVAARGRLVAELPGGAMLAVPLSEGELARRLDGREGLALAGVNAPELCAVSGPEAAVAAFAAELEADGLAARCLHTSHAFHSPLVEPAVEPFREAVARCRLRPPQIPFLSNVTGTWITDEEATDPGYWARHLRDPVRFAPAVAELLAEPRRALLEVGPGNALTRLVGRHPLAKEERREGRRRPVVASLPHASDPAPDAETLLAAAAELWVAGVPAGEGFAELDAPEDPPPRRLRLPTYPFGGERHWIEAAETAAGEVRKDSGGSVVKEPDVADWFYVPLWRRGLPLEALPRPEDEHPTEERPGWLVLSGAPAGEGLGAALAAELGGRGEPAVVVSAGAEQEIGGDAGRWTLPLDAPGLEEGLDEVVQALADRGSFPGRVVCLCGLEPPAGHPGASGGHRPDPTGFTALLALVRVLSRRLHGRPVELAVVTDRLFDVAGEGGRHPERGALAGLARVVPQEHPAIRCRSIDLALRSPGDGGGAGDPVAGAAAALVAEVRHGGGGPLLALRGPHRFEPVHERVRPAEPAGPPFDPAGHYLVTGGLGRFGLALARHLARRAAELRDAEHDSGPALRLTLLDRRAAEGEAAGELDALRVAGVEVAAVQADVADREATAAAVADAVARLGPLAGVVHAAGAPSSAFGTLADLRPEDWREHMEPKLAGAENLAHALEALPAPPPAWVLCASSLAPVLGGVGLAPFAGADAALDALAEVFDRERRAGARWRSVNWEGWEAPGGTVGGDAAG